MQRDSIVLQEIVNSIDDRVVKGTLERDAARSLIERIRLLIETGNVIDLTMR